MRGHSKCANCGGLISASAMGVPSHESSPYSLLYDEPEAVNPIVAFFKGVIGWGPPTIIVLGVIFALILGITYTVREYWGQDTVLAYAEHGTGVDSTSPDGSYQATFPTKASVGIADAFPIPAPSGIRIFKSQPGSSYYYTASWVPIPGELSGGIAVNSTMDWVAERLTGGAVVETSLEVTEGKYRGFDVLYNDKGRHKFILMRYFAVGRRVYMIGVASPSRDALGFDRLVESFRPLKTGI